MCKPNWLFEIKPDDDFGAGWSGQRAFVSEVPLEVIRQNVEKREWMTHHHTGVRLRDVHEC